MANREITLLELHFHSDGDVQVGPRALGRGTEAETKGRSLRRSLLASIALLALTAVVAVVLRAVRER